MSVERPLSPTARGSGSAFILGTALATVGGALGLISATGITTSAGGLSRGALYTGVYLAINISAGSLGLPYVPEMAHRLGVRRAFTWLLAIVAISWTSAGMLLLLGLPAFSVMLACGPIIGAATSMSSTLAPLVARSYLASSDTSTAIARMSVVKGLSWGVGAAIGGIMIGAEASTGMGMFLLIAGLLKLPIVLAVTRWTPGQSIATPAKNTSSWGGAVSVLRQSRKLRSIALLAIGMALFVSPVLLMAVPLAQALTPSFRFQAAGLLLASYAVGQLLCPLVVAWLRRGWALVEASARAAVGAGIVLLAGGVTAVGFTLLVPAARRDLLLLAILGVCLGIGVGAFRFGAQALMLGAAAEALGRERAATPLAAVRLCGTVAAPLGVLGWSALLGVDGAGLALTIGGIGIVTLALIVLGMIRMDAPESTQYPSAGCEDQ